MISFNCSGCKHRYEVPEKYAGHKVRCKKCNTINNIPALFNGAHEKQTLNELSGLDPEASDLKKKPPFHSGRRHSSPVLKDQSFLKCFKIKSNKTLLRLCVISLVCCLLFGLGIYIYLLDKQTKDLYSACQKLQQDAYDHWSNRDYITAKKMYEDIIEQTAFKKDNDRLFGPLKLDSLNNIEKINTKLFAQEHLPHINELYHQGNKLFEILNIKEATKNYKEIVEFVEKHNVQKDEDFGWIYNFSKRRIHILENVSYLNDNDLDFLKNQSRERINQLFEETIKYYATITKPSEAIIKSKEHLQNIYDSIEQYHKQVDEERILREKLQNLEIARKKACEEEEKREITLRGKHADYPIEINCSNIHEYYRNMFNTNNNLQSLLEGKSFYTCILISSGRSEVAETVLIEINDASSWDTTTAWEKYFHIDSFDNSESGDAYKLVSILHSEALPIGTTPDGYTDINYEDLKIIFHFHINSDEATKMSLHIEKKEPIMVTWMIDLNQSSKINKYQTGPVLINHKSISYDADVVRYELLSESDQKVVNLYSLLKDIKEFNKTKNLKYLLDQMGNPQHDQKLQQTLAEKQKENVRQSHLYAQEAENAPRRIAEPYIEQLIQSGLIKSATFVGYTNFRGDQITISGGLQPGKEVYVKYTVQYISKAGFLMQGIVGIQVYVDQQFNWTFGKIYFNGHELWTQ